MSHRPEENLLDQSLRDAFNDYTLVPSEHQDVWTNVQARLSGQPVATKGWRYRLLLPLTAAGGLALGWLLPRPAATPAPAVVPPVVRTAAITLEDKNDPRLATIAPYGDGSPEVQRAITTSNAPKKRNTHTKVSQVIPEPTIGAVAPSYLLTTTDSTQASALVSAITDSVSAPVTASASTPAATSGNSFATHAEPAASPSAKTTKPDLIRERHLSYRKSSHRTSEPGTTVRRWLTSLTQPFRRSKGGRP